MSPDPIVSSDEKRLQIKAAIIIAVATLTLWLPIFNIYQEFKSLPWGNVLGAPVGFSCLRLALLRR